MTVTHEKLVERQYGDRADAYVNSASHSAGPDLDRIEAVVRTHPEARVLDLGCGGGHVAYRAAPHVREVVACDLLPAMLAAVEKEAERRGLANIRVQAAPAEALPFADASFDMVLCRFTAHHWRDWEAGLREARNAALRSIEVRKRTAPNGSKPARAAMPTPMPSASNSCAREKLASDSFERASASAVRSGLSPISETTRLTIASCRARSSRIAAWRAITCAISFASTEDSSEVSLASAISPRVM